MQMPQSKANKQTPRTFRGFSTIELIITATVLTIVTGLGLMGITRAKASIRLSGSAREFASYIEKARLYSIRRHANDAAERANLAINDNKTSYNVSMDLDGDGGMDTRTINLPSGIEFRNSRDDRLRLAWPHLEHRWRATRRPTRRFQSHLSTARIQSRSTSPAQATSRLTAEFLTTKYRTSISRLEI